MRGTQRADVRAGARARSGVGRVTLWTPQPAAMATCPILLTASPTVQALVWRLAAVSTAGRVAIGATPEATVTAVCGGAAWAVDALDDARDLKLVRVEAEALVLRWAWPTLGREGATVAEPAPTPRRGAELDLDARKRARLRYKFEHRLDRFAKVPTSVTWSEVLDPSSSWHRLLSADGRADRTGSDRDTPGDIPVSREPGATGIHRDTKRDTPGDTGTPPSPHLSPPEKKREGEDARPRASEAGDDRDTKRDTPGQRDSGTEPGDTGTSLVTPWSVLVESAGGAVEGLTADPATAAAINATLREKLDASPPTLTLADVRGFGEVLKRDGAKAHFAWIKRKYATARDLHGYHRNCSPLLEALADWKRAQSEAPSAPATLARPKRAPRKPITPELRARLNSKETPV